MGEFDPRDHSVEEVLEELESADPSERERILAAERSGKARKGILKTDGGPEEGRTDASGRVLYPWEVDPGEQVQRGEAEDLAAATDKVEVEEEDASDTTPQPAETPADSGTADPGVA